MVEFYEAYADYNDAATRLEGRGRRGEGGRLRGELAFATMPWRR